MKIVITRKQDDIGLANETMDIDDKERLYVGPLCECPEDATLERDLVSCSDVADYMKEAYEAGKRGEEFEIHLVKEVEKPS